MSDLGENVFPETAGETNREFLPPSCDQPAPVSPKESQSRPRLVRLLQAPIERLVSLKDIHSQDFEETR